VVGMAEVFTMNIEELIAKIEESNMGNEAKAETIEIIRLAVS